MRFVRQKHKYGCAIAAIAMLTGVGYDRVMQFKTKSGNDYKVTTFNQLIRILNKFKVKYVFSQRKIQLLNLKHNALISVNITPDIRHAVVWDATRKRILDPFPIRPYLTKKYVQNNMNYVIKIIE